MLFPTFQFAAFFAGVFLLSWQLVAWPGLWRYFLLFAGVIFYGAWDPSFLPLLMGLAAVNHLAGRRLARHPSRAILIVAISLNLAVLAGFKYIGFICSNLNVLLSWLQVEGRVPLYQAQLPLGLSFVVFQAISYIVDVYRGKLASCAYSRLVMYLTFFPHVVAGPIVRASEFLPQIETPPDPRRIEAGRAFWLIQCGMFKKVVLASYLASTAVDPVFAVPAAYAYLDRLVALYAYALQIYFDFSGYTDIAIGVALLLGVRFPPNFDSPYRSASIQEFWRRWHITLSRWLRDFLYIPLGGSKGGHLNTYRNLMLTMLLGGLWHGANWTFVIWGFLHGLALAVERWLESRWDFVGDRFRLPVRVVRTVLTFHIVCLCWVFFRAESLGIAMEFFERTRVREAMMVSSHPMLAVVLAGGIAVQFVPTSWEARWVEWLSARGAVSMGVALGVALALITVLGPQGVPPFIYFQF
jgi:alginate O-acetyltransferase complex protein AlgI